MSESNLEQLLSELQLVEPSPELNDRVLNCFKASSGNVNSPSVVLAANRTTFIYGAVAVALLVGCAAGFFIGSSASATQQDGMTQSTGLQSNGKPPNTEADQHASTAVMAVALKGPAVGVTCGLTERTLSSELQASECQDCHSGLSGSQKLFQERHVALSQFATCTLCHASDMSLKVLKIENLF